MNILQINSGDQGGGACVVSWYIKKILEEFGHNTPMFVVDKRSADENVLVIPHNKFQIYLSYILSNDIDFYGTDYILKTKEFKTADVVHCHNLHDYFFNIKTLEKISKLKPVIWTLHDMWAITSHCAHAYDGSVKNGFFVCPSLKTPPRLTWNNERYLCWKKSVVYKKSKFHIVVPSLWMKNKIQQSILKDKPISVIHNGVDTFIFKLLNKENCRKELHLPTEKKIILYVANGGKNNIWKGWNYVKEIAKRYENNKEIIFLCVGGREDKKHTDQNILYIPFVSEPNNMAQYYSAADILLFPSLAESFGLVLVESLACGTPVVSFEVGIVSEIVTHKKNGYVAKYRDIDDLVNGLDYFLSLSEEEIIQNRKNMIELVKNNFDKNMMVEKYFKLYQALV